MHWITPKGPWTIQGQSHPMHVLLVPCSPKFKSVSLYGQLFLTILSLVDWLTSKWPWTVQSLRYLITFYYYHYSKLQFTFLYSQFFSQHRPSALNNPQMALNITKLKHSLSIYILLVSQNPKFHSNLQYSPQSSHHEVLNINVDQLKDSFTAATE